MLKAQHINKQCGIHVFVLCTQAHCKGQASNYSQKSGDQKKYTYCPLSKKATKRNYRSSEQINSQSIRKSLQNYLIPNLNPELVYFSSKLNTLIRSKIRSDFFTLQLRIYFRRYGLIAISKTSPGVWYCEIWATIQGLSECYIS